MTSSKTLVWRPDSDSQNSAFPQPKEPTRRPHPDRRSQGRRTRTSQSRRSRRPLSPELLAQIRAEGYGRSYVQKQIRKRNPMVLELYGETVKGIIIRRLTYSLDILSEGQVRRIEKIDIKYMYKQEQASLIRLKISYDEVLKHQNLVSIVSRFERYGVDDTVLSRCYKERIPVIATLKGGEIITGIIDWFSQYEIKINLNSGKGVVVFRHGLHNFQTNS